MLKSLASCTPREFLKQTNRIRKLAEKWLAETKILEIRKTQPEYPEGASEEVKDQILQAQIKQNLTRMFDAILEDNSEDTLELLGLICFIEPEEIDDHPMEEYIETISGIISNRAVLGFFTSLARLGQMRG